MTTSDETRAQRGPGLSLFLGIYGQIAAVLGALSLIVFLGNVIDLGLKGVIREIVEWWVLNVRPIVGLPIHWLVQQLPETWRFEVPDILKDYFAVGVVTVLSLLRVEVTFDGTSSISPLTPDGREKLGLALLLLSVWPLIVYWAIVAWNETRLVFLFLSPLIYLGLILASNTWLL
ncbi:MAG: hypothetical protein ACK6A4_02380 [Alphaproteobacteria bacterium]|jgi:hypothetical protein